MSETQTAVAERATVDPVPDEDEILRVEGLVKHFPIKAGVLKHTVGQVLQEVSRIKRRISSTIGNRPLLMRARKGRARRRACAWNERLAMD